MAGLVGWPGQTFEPGPRRGAIWRDDAGEVRGAVAYKVEEGWRHNRPHGTAEVVLLVGATPEAERELWRHLCEVDWVRTVTAGNRGLDDPMPLFLHDGRAARRVDQFDCIWARGARRPRACSAPDGRRWRDERWSRWWTRWATRRVAGRSSCGPDGSTVERTDADADVTLPVGALGAACLGGRSVRRLLEAGWVDEERPGGVDRLDALLTTPTLPWSPTTY